MADRAKANPLRSAAELGFAAAISGALGLDSVPSAISNAGSLFRGEGLSGMKFGLTRLTAALAPILDVATRPDILPQMGALRRSPACIPTSSTRLADLDSRMRQQTSTAIQSSRSMCGGKPPAFAPRSSPNWQISDTGPAGLPGRGQMAGAWTIDDIRTAIGGSRFFD